MALRVIVVGAGAAGLAAARRLQDAGHSPVVVEAKEHVGGRARTRYDLAPHPVESGAEFIHGTTGPTWGLLRQHELGTVFAYRNHGPEVFEYVDGVLRDQTDPAAGSFFDVAEQVATTAAETVTDTSLAAVLDDAVRASVAKPSDAETRLYDNTFTVYVTEDLDRVGIHGIRDLLSADPAAEPDPDPDWNYRVEEGYSALWDRVAAGLDVRLGIVVEAIAHDASGVRVTTSAGVLDGDAVVVTLPLGVLKAGSVRFDPPLPESKARAIADLGAGVVNKVVMEFEEAFWPDELGLVFTDLDSQCFWPPGAGRDTPSSVLTWWSSGSVGRSVAEDVDRSVEGALADLRRIFSRTELPALLSYEAICWGTDPYALTAYSYIPVAQDDRELHDLMAERVGNLFFAGEATARPPGAASVPGAFESGRRAANELLETLDSVEVS